MKIMLTFFLLLMMTISQVGFTADNTKTAESQSNIQTSLNTQSSEGLYSQESLQGISKIINGTEIKGEKLAYCISTICCKTTYSGEKFCKEVCGICPIGWTPSY